MMKLPSGSVAERDIGQAEQREPEGDGGPQEIVHGYSPRPDRATMVPMIIRVMPRSMTKPAQAAKMTIAAVPRLICGMESGDMRLQRKWSAGWA